MFSSSDNIASSQAGDQRTESLRRALDDWCKPLLSKLDAAERDQDWPRVEGICKQILQRDGDNWAIWQRLALSLEARSHWTQAETLWRHLTQRFGQRPEPYLALASLQRKRGAPDAARLVLEQAERKLGSSAELSASLGVIDDPWTDSGSVHELSNDAPASAIAAALHKAQNHLDAGRWAEAEACFEQLIVARPASLRFHFTLAQLRLRGGEFAQVVAQLSSLYQPCPQFGPLVQKLDLPLLLAEAFTQLERWGDLKVLLSGLQVLHPQDARLPYGLAQVALAEDNDLEALPLLQRSLALQPSFARAELALGQLNMRLGDWQAAIEALSRAVALEPRLEQAALQLEQARREQLWQQGEAALANADWSSAERFFRLLLDRVSGETRALERLELLASLEPQNLITSTYPSAGDNLQGVELRLAEFSSSLDRLEAQLSRHL